MSILSPSGLKMQFPEGRSYLELESDWLCVSDGEVDAIHHWSAFDSVVSKTAKALFSFQQHLIQTEHDLIYLQTIVIIFCTLFCLKG